MGKKDGFWAQVKKNRMIYLLLSPFFILFLCFTLYPICFSLFVSFTKWDGIGEMTQVGIRQYQSLLTDKDFIKSIGNTLIIFAESTVPMLLIALVTAFLLNSRAIKRPNLLKTIYFLPNVTSIVAIAIIFSTIFGNHFGIINYIINLCGGKSIAWLKKPQLLQASIATLVAWRWTGYNMVIYLAGLQRISPDINEAASIDGASMWQIFWRITLPLLNPIIIFTVITTTIGGMQIFTEAQMLVEGTTSRGGGGGAGGGGLTLVFFLYRLAFVYNQYSYACAVSWALVLLIAAISGVLWFVLHRKD